MNQSRRGQRLLLAVSVVSLSLFALAPASASAETFWVQAGSGLRRGEGDPGRFQAKEWHVRLYKLGQRTGGADHWGLITAKSAAAAMKELLEDQKIERTTNKFFRGDPEPKPSDLTYFNPLGPIAVLDESGPRPNNDLYDRFVRGKTELNKLRKMYKAYRSIQDALSREDGNESPVPRPTFGNVLNEYAQNFKQVQVTLASFEKIMRSDRAAIDDLMSMIEQEVRQLQAKASELDAITSNAVAAAQAHIPEDANCAVSVRTHILCPKWTTTWTSSYESRTWETHALVQYFVAGDMLTGRGGTSRLSPYPEEGMIATSGWAMSVHLSDLNISTAKIVSQEPNAALGCKTWKLEIRCAGEPCVKAGYREPYEMNSTLYLVFPTEAAAEAAVDALTRYSGSD